MEFAERIREERNRLGLSQGDFADKCGVSKRTQASYEAGTSCPDLRYLAAAEAAGVDVPFLVSGRKTEHVRQMGTAILRVFECFEKRVPALEPYTILGIIQMIAQDEANAKDAEWKGGFVSGKERQKLVDALLDHASLMGDLLFAIGTAQRNQGVKLPPDKYIRLALRLLSIFKDHGEIDPAKVSEAVTLLAD